MKDDRLYLIHIIECIKRIEEYKAEGKEMFMNSTLIQDAVLHNLQTMAESTQRLSDRLKTAHPEVRWRGLAGFRNVLVHDYLGVDFKYIWQIVEEKLPEFKQQVESMLRELNS